MKNNLKSFSEKKPLYKLRNPHKYIGDPDNVIYRSTWELNVFKFCDNNKNVIAWSSEEIIIPYMKPVIDSSGMMKTKPANYYPDVYIEYVNKNGEVVKELLEIKPKKQTRASKARTYSTKLFENMTYAVNLAKWDAAKKWCMQRGIKFCIITEDSLFKNV